MLERVEKVSGSAGERRGILIPLLISVLSVIGLTYLTLPYLPLIIVGALFLF